MGPAFSPIISGIFRALVLQLLLVPVLIYAGDLEKGYDYRIGELDSAHIPGYESVPILRNYLINQTWISILRGGIIGSAVGGTVGGISDLAKPDDEWRIIPHSVIGLVVGVPIGGGVGMGAGLIKGAIFNRKARQTPQFHARRMRIGFINPVLLRSDHRIKRGYDFGASISYRTLAESRLWPDQIRITYIPEFWYPSYSGPNGIKIDLITNQDVDCILRRAESAALYDGPRWTVFVPYAGIAAGYCRGELELSYSLKDSADDPYAHWYFEETKEIRTPSIRIMTGLRLDLFDLAFAEAEFSYEPIGPYLQMKKFVDLPYANNFTFGFAFGAFIF